MIYRELASGIALVTGGTSGIGKACVERLRAEDMTVAFTGRSDERGRKVAAATGGTFIRCDARDRAACDRSVADAAELGRASLRVLVASAGIIYSGPLETTPEPAFRELIEVNLTAVFRYARACFDLMRDEGGGSIICIASDAGIRGVHEIPAYSVTKAGVVALAELLAAEGAPYGIRANAVCPGDVVPGVQATVTGHEGDSEDPTDWTVPPSGRFGAGEDVANAVAWLASDQSAHMTGATLRIDGGTGAAMRAVFRT